MKVLKWIFIVLIAMLAILIVIGFAMPKETKMTTSEEINLPPAKVFHFVAGFVNRTAWDPWIKADTAVKCTFDIVPGYVGSKYNWDGPVVGKGTMLVDSVVFGSYILNQVSLMPGKFIPEEWVFTPSENGTSVKWTITMSSGSPFGRLANTTVDQRVSRLAQPLHYGLAAAERNFAFGAVPPVSHQYSQGNTSPYSEKPPAPGSRKSRDFSGKAAS